MLSALIIIVIIPPGFRGLRLHMTLEPALLLFSRKTKDHHVALCHVNIFSLIYFFIFYFFFYFFFFLLHAFWIQDTIHHYYY